MDSSNITKDTFDNLWVILSNLNKVKDISFAREIIDNKYLDHSPLYHMNAVFVYINDFYNKCGEMPSFEHLQAEFPTLVCQSNALYTPELLGKFMADLKYHEEKYKMSMAIQEDDLSKAREHLNNIDNLVGTDEEIPAPKEAINFPIEALPVDVRTYCDCVAYNLQANIDYVATAMLAAMCNIVGSNWLAVGRNGTFKRAANIWSVLVAESGSTKSDIMNMALKFSYEIDRKQKLDYQEQKSKYENELKLYNAKIKGIKSKKSNDNGENSDNDNALENMISKEPIKPVRYTLIENDVTQEALAEAVSQNKNSILIHSDEVISLLSSFDKYTGGKGNDRQFYLTARDGVISHSSLRMNRESYSGRLHVGVLGSIQPSKLEKIADGERDGFCERFYFCFPDTKIVKDFNPEIIRTIPKNVIERMEYIFQKIHSVRGYEKREVVLDVEAHSHFCKIQEYYYGLIQTDSSMASRYSKSDANVLEMAIMLHVFDMVVNTQFDEYWHQYMCGNIDTPLFNITVNVIDRAFKIVQYGNEQYKKATCSYTSREEQLIEILLGKLNKRNIREITCRDVNNIYLQKKVRNASEIKMLFQIMQQKKIGSFDGKSKFYLY